jgi:O-antigen/teichoic acid export membrane protein
LKLAGFIFFLWLARTLSVDDYATWGLLYALQTWVTSFSTVGIIEAVVGQLKSNNSQLAHEKLFSAAHGAFLPLSFFALFVGAVALMLVVSDKGSTIAIVSALASGAILGYASLQAQIVRLEEKHLASICFNFLVPMCGLVGSLVAFLLAPGVAAFFLGSTLGLGISLFAAMTMRIGFYQLPQAMVALRPVIVRTAPFFAVTLLGWLSGYGNTYLMKLFYAADDVAKFTLAFMISSAMQLVASATNQVWSPRFYRMLRAEREPVESKSHAFFTWQGIALGVVGAGLIACFPIAAETAGGSLMQYGSLSTELLLLTAAYAVLPAYWHAQNHMLARDRGSLVMNVHLLAGVLGIIALVILIWLFGPLGIYAGFLAQMTLRSAIAGLIARERWSVRTSWSGIAIGLALPFGAYLWINHR